MRSRSLPLLSLVALLPTTAFAQQLELVPEWTGFKGAELRSPSEAELKFEPFAELTRSGVQFKDARELYNDDQWTMVEPIYSEHAIGDLLVFFYDVPWDTTMKQRVREANVLDEEAIFPVPLERYQDGVEANGYWVIARGMPEHARIGVEEASQQLVVEVRPSAYTR